MLNKKAPKFWRTRNLLSYILFPFSILYLLIVALRKFFLTSVLNPKSFEVPIIIVGNITFGGTGKTPLVINLANFLQEAGYKAGIVSRGYGGKSHRYPCLVDSNSKAQEVGDEALLINKNTDCVIFVDPNRSRAIKKLIEEYNVDVIISDDGLQHYAIKHDIEIAVIDGKFAFGNRFCFPSGPLRERIFRLNSVDFVVINGLSNIHYGIDNYYDMKVIPDKKLHKVNNPSSTFDIEKFKNKKIHAVAGIGNPDNFFATLKNLGLNIKEHAFPDHHFYRKSDLNFGKEIVVMTEKDAVKCIEIVGDNFWYLPIKVQLQESLQKELLKRLSDM